MCMEVCMGRTNIVLDDELVAEAARLSGIRTKKDLVHEALRALIAARRRKSLLDLEGKIQLAPGYDHKALRPAGPSTAGRRRSMPAAEAQRTEPSRGEDG
jgi:Arc/MetJ family transcription regulator